MEPNQNKLEVKGLDAYNNTPVLDVKPCDHCNTATEIKVPEWRNKLEENSN